MTENQKSEFIKVWFELLSQYHHHDHIADDIEDDPIAEEFHTIQAEQYRNQLMGMQKCLDIIGYELTVIDGFPAIVEKDAQ